MKGLYLSIFLDGAVIVFYRGALHLIANEMHFESLLSVSSIRVTANTPQLFGAESKQAPTVRAEIDNPQHKFYNLLKLPFRHEVLLKDNTGVELFRGKISSIKYGRVITLEIGQ